MIINILFVLLVALCNIEERLVGICVLKVMSAAYASGSRSLDIIGGLKDRRRGSDVQRSRLWHKPRTGGQ